MKEEEKGLTVHASDSQSQYMVVNGYPVRLIIVEFHNG